MQFATRLRRSRTRQSTRNAVSTFRSSTNHAMKLLKPERSPANGGDSIYSNTCKVPSGRLGSFSEARSRVGSASVREGRAVAYRKFSRLNAGTRLANETLTMYSSEEIFEKSQCALIKASFMVSAAVSRGIRCGNPSRWHRRSELFRE